VSVDVATVSVDVATTVMVCGMVMLFDTGVLRAELSGEGGADDLCGGIGAYTGSMLVVCMLLL
jgi:hypothetical protein